MTPYGYAQLINIPILRSPAVGDFYGTGIEIWAGFVPNMANFPAFIASKSFDL
jgi:hypothetical protein